MMCAAVTLGVSAQQEVNTAVGVRFGSPYAISAKKFFGEQAAVEIFAGLRPYFALPYSYGTVGGAYLHHIPFGLDDELESLHWYVGGGAAFQFWRYNDNFFGGGAFRDDFADVAVRVSGYVGLQYALEDTPIEFTLDVSPSYVVGQTPFNNFRFLGYYTLGVRYILERQ